MNLMQTIHQLPRSEKLQIMEYLWKELSEEEVIFESPEWHKKALAETESGMEQGKDVVLDWDKAKKRLRKNFE